MLSHEVLCSSADDTIRYEILYNILQSCRSCSSILRKTVYICIKVNYTGNQMDVNFNLLRKISQSLPSRIMEDHFFWKSSILFCKAKSHCIGIYSSLSTGFI